MQANESNKIAQLSFEEFLVPILQHRKRILTISFLVAAATLAINFIPFLVPVYYKASATLLPETQKDKLSALGQFADIAQLAGVNVPGSEIARLYPTIITSETILRNVIERKYQTREYADSVDLIAYFDFDEDTAEKKIAKTIKTLRLLMTASFESKTSVVSLSMEMPEPQLAADVLNGVINELDRFMRFKKVNNASEQVRWISLRTKEVQEELRSAEETLKDFRERNRRFDSPNLLLQQERLIRDVNVKSTVFVELKKQYELAKLEEIKNISIVNVLDPGRAPVKKERPTRLTNSLLMFLLTLAFCAAFYVFRAIYLPQLVKSWSVYRNL